MHRRLQFGMRENPASDRRHGSRSEVVILSNGTCAENRSSPELPLASADRRANAVSPDKATGGEGDDAATCNAVTDGVWSAEKSSPRFEPLIGSHEAARLLGNIHVKTLQRYARQRRIPGYQIGGHWYFRASELDSWVHSLLNSSCHPCRSNQEAR
jgi:excisionase family DNA binding protein